MSDPGNPPLKAAGIGAYALGSLGTGLFSTVPAVLLLFYCTETLHIPAALAAVVVFVPKIWSIVWDPLVGLWSDRTRTVLGRRTPFLFFGGLGLSAAFVATFNTPELDPSDAFLWILVTYFLLATLYSIFAVPYVAIPAELGKTQRERSALIAARMTFSSLGNLAGAAGGPLMVEHFGGGRAGYGAMAWALAIFCLIALAGPIIVMRGREQMSVPARTGRLLSQLTVAVRNREFRFQSASYFFQIGGSAAFVAMVPYLAVHVAGQSEGQIGIALGLMLTVATFSAPFWGWAGQRFGNKSSNIVALLLFALGLAGLGILALAGASWMALLAVFATLGFAFSATQVLPFVALAHLAHGASESGATGSEGAFAGTWTAIEKLGLATGPMIAGIALSLIGTRMATGVPIYIAVAAPIMLLVAILPLLWVSKSGDSPTTA